MGLPQRWLFFPERVYDHPQPEQSVVQRLPMSNFPPEVAEQIGFYVYRLEDPRDDKTFYVGKGKEAANASAEFEHMYGIDKLGDRIQG